MQWRLTGLQFCALVALSQGAPDTPEQIHIAYGTSAGFSILSLRAERALVIPCIVSASGLPTADSMVVSWATPSATPRAAVTWGMDPSANTTTSIGVSERFVQLLNSTSKTHVDCHTCVDEYFHTVTLSGLRSATRRVLLTAFGVAHAPVSTRSAQVLVPR